MSFKRPGVHYLQQDEIRPCNLRREQVEDYAASVAGLLGFAAGGDLQDFIPRLHGRVHLKHLDELIEATDSGSIYVHAEWDFDIVLPYYTSPLRDQFTIAHELGHYFLHSGQGAQPIIATRQGSSAAARIEWEANWFAAGLLMPRDAFLEACEECDDPAWLSQVFGVSKDAARVRREALCVK